MTNQLPLFHPPETRETLSNNIWRACDTLCVRRDNNCGGIMEYVEHLAWLSSCARNPHTSQIDRVLPLDIITLYRIQRRE
jgi:hypothetical protein